MTDFDTTYRRYWPDVRRFSLYMCGNAAEAEDLASEAFLRAWMSSKPVRAGTVKAYLLIIVRNLYRDRARHAAVVRGGLAERGSEASTRSASPEAALVERGEVDRVMSAILELPEADRAVLGMAGIGTMSHEMIAEVLELSVSAVKVRIHRARARLSAALEDSGPKGET